MIMDDSITIPSLLLPGGLLMLGIVVTAVLLLVYPKTRVVGIVLCALCLVIVISPVSFFLYKSAAFPEVSTEMFPETMSLSVKVPSDGVGAPLEDEEKDSSTDTSAKAPPAWVGAPPRSVGDAYRMSIAVGPYTTRAECDAQLPSTLQKALDRYVEACLGEEVRRRIVLPADYLRQLVKDRWEEVRQHSFGPMTTQHVLLEFDRKAKDRVLDELQRTAVAGRLWFAGVGWAVWLALLGGVYGYLRNVG